MADHKKRCSLSHALIFILSCTGMIVVESARPLLPYKASQHSLSYPKLHDFPSEQLYRAYFVIQLFKDTITCDPKNITSTWTGHDICGKRSYVGFHCSRQGEGGNLTVTSAIFNGLGLCAPTLQGFADKLPDLAHFQATSNNFGGDVASLGGLTNNNHDMIFNKGAAQVSLINKFGPTISDNDVSLNGLGAGVKYMNGHITLTPHLPGSLFPKMSYMALANNKLKGPIPPSIAEARDTLLEVLLLNNQLSGCVPHELGMLSKAAVIDAGMNQLTGPIPSSFSCLNSVEQLNLADNRLYGDVPDTLCKLAGPAGRLANLTLSSNYFTSVGPTCSALIKGGVLHVKDNCIRGLTNQRRPAECAAFHSHPKTCPEATTQVTCPAAAPTDVEAPVERKARDYSSYVTYATLHE